MQFKKIKKIYYLSAVLAVGAIFYYFNVSQEIKAAENISANSNNTIADNDCLNGICSNTITPLPLLPDLEIKDIYIEDNLVKIKYCNNGDNPININIFGIETFYIRLTLNNQTHTGTSTYTGIPSQPSNYIFSVPSAGECANTDGIPLDYFRLNNESIIKDGVYLAVAVIDHLNQANESNENNNIYYKNIAVKYDIDFNNDGKVDEADQAIFKAAFPSKYSSVNYNSQYDFNKDGYVNLYDALRFRAYYIYNNSAVKSDLITAETENPLAQIVSGNRMITAANYKISAINDNYTVKSMNIKLKNPGAIFAVNRMYLYDGNRALTPYGVYFDINGNASTTGLSLLIPVNTTKTITIKLVLNNIGENAAAPGLNVATVLNSVVAINDRLGEYKYIDDDREGNDIYVYKTYPLVSANPIPTVISNNSSQAIYKFTIASPVSSGAYFGAVGLKQFAIGLEWKDVGYISNNNLELYNWRLYRGTADITSLVNIYTDDNLSVKDVSAYQKGASSSATSVVYVSWSGASEERIYTSATYTLKASPRNFDSNVSSADQVTLTFLGDTFSHNGSNRYLSDVDRDNHWGLSLNSLGANETEYNFIWSDRSSAKHSAAANASSADWANGYLVKYLPLKQAILRKN